MIGLELEDARAIAVRINARGAVQARAVTDAAGGDLAAAARRALETVEAGPDGGAIGVAAANPDLPAVASVIAVGRWRW